MVITAKRVVGIWLMLVVVESLHGIMRRLVLEPRLGDLLARQMSVLTGAVLIIIVFWFTLRWVGPQPNRRWWAMGLLWLIMTLAFEIGLGRAVRSCWTVWHLISTRDVAASWRSACSSSSWRRECWQNVSA